MRAYRCTHCGEVNWYTDAEWLMHRLSDLAGHTGPARYSNVAPICARGHAECAREHGGPCRAPFGILIPSLP